MQIKDAMCALVVVTASARAHPAWGEAPEADVMVAMGVHVRHFAASDRGTAARVIGPVTASDSDALTATERLAFGLTPPLYVALEVELGNFAYTGTTRSARDALLVGSGAVGLRATVGTIALSAELAGGGLAYSHPDETGLCGDPLVEVRGRAELFVTPWFTVGGTIGTSILREDEWLVGVSLATHTAPYARF